MITKGKVVKTECIEARIKKDFKISVNVTSKGKDCFDDSQEIRATCNANGTLIVHSCNEIFISTENIDRIETYTDEDSKRNYTRIFFKKEVL